MEAWNSAHRLHAEMEPSVAFADGWAIHSLHGVLVPGWLAMDHPDELDARKILQIQNVDIRREGIRRAGIARIIEQLEPKVLSTQDSYALLAVEMNYGKPWRFLKMVNPSIGCVHIEAVPRECETVQHAINWRKSQSIKEDWFPSQLT